MQFLKFGLDETSDAETAMILRRRETAIAKVAGEVVERERGCRVVVQGR